MDRNLLKNLLLSYFNTPEARRLDAVHVIGSLLGFSAEEMIKVCRRSIYKPVTFIWTLNDWKTGDLYYLLLILWWFLLLPER